MSYSLNSPNRVILGITIGDIKGDTRSLDYGSHGAEIAAWSTLVLAAMIFAMENQMENEMETRSF